MSIYKIYKDIYTFIYNDPLYIKDHLNQSEKNTIYDWVKFQDIILWYGYNLSWFKLTQRLIKLSTLQLVHFFNLIRVTQWAKLCRNNLTVSLSLGIF